MLNKVFPRYAAATLFQMILFVSVASAQDASTEVNQLTVREAIKLAHDQHPALNKIREKIREKGGERISSLGIHSPALSYTKEGIDDGIFAEQRVGVSQAIDFPLSSYYKVSQKRTEQEALMLELESATHMVKGSVKRAYTNVLFAQALVQLHTQEVRLAEQLTEVASVRTEVGEVSELELMKAEIQGAEARSNLEDTQRQFQNARLELLNIIGLDPDIDDSSITFPDTLIYVISNLDHAAALSRLGLQPELLSASKSVDAAQFGVKGARSALLPAIQVDLFKQDFGSGYDRYGFQIGLRLPLWVVPNHKGAVQIAKAQSQRLVWHKQAVFIDLKKQVEQAWAGYQSSKNIIDRYNSNVRTKTEELLAKTQEGYRLGELDLLTLLDTQRTYLASERRYYNALRDYYDQLIELERFTGEDLVFNTGE
ncbi:MAG: TolC family protein [Rhodothermales bacterium]